LSDYGFSQKSKHVTSNKLL